MSEPSGAGLAALQEGSRVDFNRLRSDRRRRLFDAMAAAEVDVLLLGRPANVGFASGARQLWTSGPRPFSPACVVVAGGQRVHLLSTWDEGVPAEIPHSDLHGPSWNPAVTVGRLRSIPGLGSARRVGTDGWSPGTDRLLSDLCPEAESVDAGGLLRRARSAKSPDELACIVTASAVAEAGLSAMTGALRPGVTERELVGVCAGAIAGLGLTCVPGEGVAWVTTGPEPVSRPRRVATDRPLAEGDLVALNPGAMYAGYEATLGRTRRVGGGPHPAPAGPASGGGLGEALLANRAVLDAVIGACRPGATGADLLDIWHSNGGGPLPELLAWGVGMGVEAPVIGPSLGRGAVLRAGVVLAVQAWTVHDGVGGLLEQELVSVGPEGPTVITRGRSGL